MTLRIDIDKITMPFRRALLNDPNVSDDDPPALQMKQLGESNDMIVEGYIDGIKYWVTDALVFPSEKEYLVFMMKWN
jgi:hypothetical protein